MLNSDFILFGVSKFLLCVLGSIVYLLHLKSGTFALALEIGEKWEIRKQNGSQFQFF